MSLLIAPDDLTPVDAEDRVRVGPLGLEAVHVVGGLRLNTNRDEGYPRVKFTTMGGFHGLPDTDDNREPRFGQIGEKARPSLPRGKTISIEGEIQALTITELRDAQERLRRVLGDRRFELPWSIEPHPENVHGVPMTWRARTIGFTPDEEQTYRAQHQPSPWCRPFALDLRMGDPRFYDTEELTAEAGPAVWEEDEDGWTAYMDCENPGSAPTDPVFTVTGPCALGWSIANTEEPFRDFEVNLALDADESAICDFAQRLVTVGGLDVTGYVSFNESTWWNEGVWGLDPGVVNTIRLSGGMAGGSIAAAWHAASY